MRKSAKRALTLLLILALSLSLSAGALAADTAVSVWINGRPVEFTAAPESRDGVTYAPLSALFKALGANQITWKEAAQTVVVVRGDDEAAFVIGDRAARVTVGDETTEVTLAGAPYLKNGLSYVPIRSALELFGLRVGWDADDATVVVADLDAVLAGNDATYEILDQYFAQAAFAADKNYAMEGKFNAQVQIADGGDTHTVTVNGTLTGLSDANAAELSMKLKTNLSSKALAGQGFAVPQSLEELSVDCIADMQTGTYYIRSPLLASGMGAAGGDAWFMLDMNSLLGGADMPDGYTALLGTTPQVTNTRELIGTVLGALPLNDRETDPAQVLSVLNLLLADTAFKKTDAGYVADYAAALAEQMGKDLPEGLELRLTLPLKDGKPAGMKMDASLIQAGMEFSIYVSTDAKLKTQIKIVFSLEDAITVKLDMEMTQTETQRAPASAPPEGSEIVPLDGISVAVIG